MTAEEWRPIPGFPDYRVSSLGRVVSDRQWRGTRGRELRGGVGKGYRSVYVSPPGGTKVNRSVHVLVAAAFLGPCPDGMEVRHLDGDSTNNAAANLAYGTHAENMADQRRHGTHPNAAKTRCKSGHPFDDQNTRIDPRTGMRICRPCARDRMAAARRLPFAA